MEEGLLRNVHHHESFHLSSGRTLKNLHELANALVSMDEVTFSHHVTKDKNDFASWILGVFKDEELASQIRKLRNREAIQRKLNETLKAQTKRTVVVARQEPAPIARQETKKPSAIERFQKFIPKKKAAPVSEQKEKEDNHQIHKKLDAILQKEKEIDYKEKKLLEIEEKLERKLLGERDHQFFSKEFVQGVVTGFLVTLIGVLIYVKFIVQA